jgi:hypothetical protein
MEGDSENEQSFGDNELIENDDGSEISGNYS